MSKSDSDSKPENGTVMSFDATRGVAQVQLETSGRTASMHAAAFISGRPARLPAVGDAVRAQVQSTATGAVVVVATPAAKGTPNR